MIDRYAKYRRGKDWLKRMEGWSDQKKAEKTAKMIERIRGKPKPPKGAIPIDIDKRDRMSKNGCAICGRNDVLYDSGPIYVCDDCLQKMKVRSGHNYVVLRTFYPVTRTKCSVCKREFDLMHPKLMHIVRANVCPKCLWWLGYQGQGRFKRPKFL